VAGIVSALETARFRNVRGKPSCIVLHTVKGKGIRECEFDYRWHTHAPDIGKANEFLRELAARYGGGYVPVTWQAEKDGGIAKVLGEAEAYEDV